MESEWTTTVDIGPLPAPGHTRAHIDTACMLGLGVVYMPSVASLFPPHPWGVLFKNSTLSSGLPALLTSGRLRSPPEWDMWPSVKNLWDPGPDSGATSDQPNQPQGRIHTQVVGRFRLCQGARLAEDRVGTFRVDPGTGGERLGPVRGPGAGSAPPGLHMFSPCGPVAPPTPSQLCSLCQ